MDGYLDARLASCGRRLFDCEPLAWINLPQALFVGSCVFLLLFCWMMNRCNGEMDRWNDGSMDVWMRRWLDVHMRGLIVSLWRGLTSRKLCLSVVVCYYCCFVG